jgi:hypothetical protein
MTDKRSDEAWADLSDLVGSYGLDQTQVRLLSFAIHEYASARLQESHANVELRRQSEERIAAMAAELRARAWNPFDRKPRLPARLSSDPNATRPDLGGRGF